MQPRFSIAIDPARDLVTIVMTGLLLPADVADFYQARGKAHAKLRCASRQHLTLADLRAMNIMPQETVDAFTRLLNDPQSRSRRLAFVVGPTLVRSQVIRALAGRDARCFDDPAAAQAWLLEEDDDARAALSLRRPPGDEAPPLRAVA